MKKPSSKTLLRLATAVVAVLVLIALGMFVHAAVVNARARARYRELSALVVRLTPAPTEVPTPAPTDAATPTPEETATPAPTDAPAAPTAGSTEEPTPEPTPEPTLEPTPESTPEPTPEPTVALTSEPTAEPTPAPTAEHTPEASEAPLADYEALYARNPDFFGWISVPGTNVDYPIMYSPDRPLQYLGHDFDGRFSYAGVPFLKSECDPEGSYYLIYGHHMKDGTMFAGLMAYENRSFWLDHPTFRCDTRQEHRTYAVVAAFRAQVLQKQEEGFRYYSYVALDDEETFQTFMDNVRAMAAYDTGVETAFGDEILTLSTCAYHTEKGRFVVVAKRVE